ncbi:MAG: hypothetical protein LBC03_05710 [Nitrososphaerota archaeon]|jgi:hypothetical protein|nr:hypothetical protein [Nitrososphaerota archaeon]
MSIFLICVIALSSSSLTYGNFASASTGAANFLPNYYYKGSGTFDTANEISLSLSTAKYITTQLSTKYPSSYFAAYETNCNLANYQSVTSYLQNYDNAVVFSKGHRDVSSGHYALLDHYAVDFWDSDIYGRTSSKNKVTFIWHCETAYPYNYNGNNMDANNKAVGMPFAWTHNNQMIKYGAGSTSSYGNQVYLGWDMFYGLPLYNGTTLAMVASPQYEWKASYNNDYADVAMYFWSYMRQGYSVSDSLNKVSYLCYSNIMPFDYCPLKGWLVYYGNGAIGLP